MYGGRNYDVIVEALESLAQAIGHNLPNNQNARENDEFRALEVQKVQFGPHMLSKEAKDWWDNMHQRLDGDGTDITWTMFRAIILEKYFLEDVCSKKKIEFLALKQGSSTVVGYATKFEELCWIYDEDNRARSAHYKSLSEKKGKGQFRGNLYVTPPGKGKQKATIEKKPSGGSSCFSPIILVIAIIDTGTTHSFISLDYAKRLELKLSSMVGSMVVDTPGNGLVTTSLVCLKCPLIIYGKSFVMDLVCLQLSQLDVILRMNWLEFNRVHTNYFSKTVMFPDMGGDGVFMFIFSKQVEEFFKEEAQVFSKFYALGIDSKAAMRDLLVVCDFPKVFPDDINDLPPEHEVEFSIDLVPGTSLVLMAPYRMSALELSELKK
ncbi:uncharacterized protein LOC127104575 [Lathyrus oleraceus]|uniref:uncharacterized protein LOC127104575 n=1 Tax=Pisum sativum TaxID=3888 RepID=UPI0021D35A8E|nr:uncharacterized protein LOC127104575 [Pisum sativum]